MITDPPPSATTLVLAGVVWLVFFVYLIRGVLRETKAADAAQDAEDAREKAREERWPRGW